jgi:hypothetical protein
MLQQCCPSLETKMYAIEGFFVEVFPEHIPGDGWTSDARFSLQSDYKRHDYVPTVTWPSHIDAPTKGAVERATVLWVRQFLRCSSDVMLSCIRIERESFEASKRK